MTEVLTARELKAQLRLRCATATLAKQRARKIIIAGVRARGQRPSDYANRDLSLMAEQYMAEHWEELRPRARALAEEILTKRR